MMDTELMTDVDVEGNDPMFMAPSRPATVEEMDAEEERELMEALARI